MKESDPAEEADVPNTSSNENENSTSLEVANDDVAQAPSERHTSSVECRPTRGTTIPELFLKNKLCLYVLVSIRAFLLVTP